MRRRADWTVLTVLDDDRAKQGLRIAGVTVGGTIGDLALPHVLAGVTHVIIAMPSASAEQLSSVLALARHTGLAVMSVPGRAALRADDLSAL